MNPKDVNKKRVKELVRELLKELAGDVDREGLKETPDRVTRAYAETLSGYGRSLKDEMTVFENAHHYDEIIYSGNINFFSTCEHHLLPFFGVAHIAYVPNEKIVGLSKLSRAIDIYSRRLQDQERITMQVANELDDLLHAKGIAVMLEAQHFCNMARGVEKINSDMKTLAFKGVFKEDRDLRESFIRMSTTQSSSR